jgi:hypothetical protein
MSADPLGPLVARVTEVLASRGVAHRLIGAAALAAHGVARSTRDVDLLVTDAGVLDASLWDGVAPEGFSLEVRRGDATDPLVGVVRVDQDLPDDAGWDFAPVGVDVVVLRGRWAEELTHSEGPEVDLGGRRVRAVDAVGLVLLKLYAGGARDAWDITSLLEGIDAPEAVIAAVDARLASLPRRCAALWRRVRDGFAER